jgi:hypothetical protein
MSAQLLTQQQRDELMKTLQSRFEKHPARHASLTWPQVLRRLEGNPDNLFSLYEMERTGGEPDVVGIDEKTQGVLFFDCAQETPTGRRNVCYDRAALDSRKNFKPETSAMELADAMGITLLTEDQYRFLQLLGEFDLKTSSWILTPPEIRKRGGALFCDRRYNHVFTYHNGAESYYAVRGFRGCILV